MKIRMLNDWVMIKKLSDPEVTEEGIITIPDRQNFQCKEGIVAAVGPGETLSNGTLVPPLVKVGDRVSFSAWSGIDLDGHSMMRQGPLRDLIHGHLFMRQSEIRLLVDYDAKLQLRG